MMTKTYEYELNLAYGLNIALTPLVWPVIILVIVVAFIIAKKRKP